MKMLVISLVAAVHLLTRSAAQSGACTRDISNLAVVNMCQEASHTLGRIFISVSSSTMGDNSVCNCTLRGKTPSQNTTTTFTFWQNGNSNYLCNTNHVTMVSWPPGSDEGIISNQNFTCGSVFTSGRFSSPKSTNAVLLTQIRTDPAAVFNYCLFLEHEDASDSIELTCQSGPVMATSTSTEPSSTSSSSSSTTSGPLSTSSTSAESKTSTASGSSTASTTGSAVTKSVTTTLGSCVATADGSFSGADAPPFPAALVAVAVVGWVLTLALAVVVLLLSLRQRRMMKSSSKPGADNSAYTSLSDVTRTSPRADPNYDVIQSERSASRPGGSDASPGGVYESVEGDNSAVQGQTLSGEGRAGTGTYCNV